MKINGLALINVKYLKFTRTQYLAKSIYSIPPNIALL